MAEGIRIVPRPDLNWPGDANVCVTDHSKPIPQPKDGRRLEDIKPPCGNCGKQHFARTWLVRMRAGSAIVSAPVWENMKRLADCPFVYANPVPNPPGQILTPNSNGGFSHDLVEKFVMPLTPPKRKAS